MKKLLCLLLLSSFTFSLAQMPTHSTEYTVSAGTISGGGSAHVYNGRVYTAVFRASEYSLQKNTLNSVPLVTKDFTGLFMDGSDLGRPYFVSGASGLFMAGRNFGSQQLYLTMLDTVTLNPVFTRTYTVGNYSMYVVNQVDFLTSGNILIAGSAGNANPNEVGFLLSLSPATNGAVVYSSTLTVAGSSVNGIYSFAEISNSTLLLSALRSSGSSIIKALKVGNTFSIVPSACYNINDISNSAYRLFKFGNPKKLIAANISGICKIDTNISIIASTPISQQVHRIGTWSGDVFHKNGRTYHYTWPSNSVEVFDTNLVSVATKTIPYNAMATRGVATSSTNLYLLQTLVSPITARYVLVKTDINAGNYPCFQNFSVSKSFINIASFSTTINTNTIVANAGFANPISTGPLATYSQTCVNNCAAPGAPSNNTPSVNLNVCANNSTTLSATSTGTVNWYSTPTGTTVVGTGANFVTPTLSAGSYTYYAEAVTCTNSINRTAIVVNVAACTGISELDVISFTRIYPNPNNGSFKIFIEENVEMEVFDAVGKTVLSGLLPKGETTININEVQPGIYFVKVRSGSAEKVLKLIKQ